MPIDKTKDAGSSSSDSMRKGRPPWVKETPNPLPTPTMPWTLNKRNSLKETNEESNKLVVPKLRKVVKNDAQENGNGKKETPMFQKPQLKPVPPKETTLQSKEVKIPIPKLNSVKDRELAPLKRNSVTDMPGTPDDIDKVIPATRNAVVRQESMKKFGMPPPPPLPPQAPPMPQLAEAANLSDKQKQALDRLRQRPKHRPDWTQMLRDLEKGRQLNHVECNDRSKPLLPKVKSKGQFIFESENHQKNDPHHDLLKQIEQGVKLKRVKTNDRSKPILEGLRKFRRQMTIEEQIIKSQSMASIPPEEVPDETDEMDDIDKVRDDLQSTKQLLAFEMRNKEAQMRENKKLLAKIQQLEAELERVHREPGSESAPVGNSSEADQKLITSLKNEAQDARKTAEELERKYAHATEELDTKKTELEEAKKQNRELEKKIQEFLTGKRQSVSAQGQNQEEEEIFEVSESESDGSDNEEKRERRAQREIKMFRNKLRSCKTKQDNAKKERVALKEQLKMHQKAIKDDKKKYKALQKEVDKMAKLMKESSEDEDEDDSDDEEEEDDSEAPKEDVVEEESESESESSESESSEESGTDSEASRSEPDDAPSDAVKENLSRRVRRRENMLAALKKGNLMLKANVERLQDDLNKQKELTMALQEDLDSVLAELG